MSADAPRAALAGLGRAELGEPLGNLALGVMLIGLKVLVVH